MILSSLVRSVYIEHEQYAMGHRTSDWCFFASHQSNENVNFLKMYFILKIDDYEWTHPSRLSWCIIEIYLYGIFVLLWFSLNHYNILKESENWNNLLQDFIHARKYWTISLLEYQNFKDDNQLKISQYISKNIECIHKHKN